MKVIYVDGYNVINSWPDLKNIKGYSYEAARQKLISLIQDYAAYKDYRVIIVFDGHKVPGNLEKKERLKNVVIIFTKEGETADNFIEKSVNDIGKKSDVTVVTSDALEQMLAFQRGATRMSSIEFFHEIQNVHKLIQKKTERKFTNERSLLEERIDKNTLEELEKIRRSR